MKKLAVILGVALYCISPIDVFPDIPPFGWLDDLGLIGAAAYYLRKPGEPGEPVSVMSPQAAPALRPDPAEMATRVAVGAVAKALKLSDANRDKLYVHVRQKVEDTLR